MDKELLGYFKAIKDVQTVIANAKTLDETVQGGLKIIAERGEAEMAILWCCDEKGDHRLHPYYWLGANDVTSKSHAPGEGVPEVYSKRGRQNGCSITRRRTSTRTSLISRARRLKP